MLRLLAVILTVTTLVSGQQEWTNVMIPGALTHVSSSLTYVWAVDHLDKIYLCRRPCSGSNQWKRIGGALMQLDVDDMEVWGVNKNNDIFKRPIDGSGSWKKVNGKLIHVSASGYSFIWGVNKANNIFKCQKPCNGKWIHVKGKLKQIDGGEREVYGVSAGNRIYSRPVDGSLQWRQIPGSLKHITASAPYAVYGVNAKDMVYRCRKPCIGEWELLSGYLGQCDGTANALFGVNSQGSLSRRDLRLV